MKSEMLRAKAHIDEQVRISALSLRVHSIPGSCPYPQFVL
eukprot:COSAG05_NODE_801_length_7224_cov_4.552000_8_plen_40_part_00